MKFALDIETACNVTGCPGYGGHKKCNHALSPWHNRITVVGIYNPEVGGRVFRDMGDLRKFMKALPTNYELGGQNFKFDMLNLRVHGVDIPLERWTEDSNLAAYVLPEKVPDAWLESYEDVRNKKGGHHRRGTKYSLKTLAPFFLGVEPFWEADDTDNDEYVLKDCQYTYELIVKLKEKLKEYDGAYEFYKERLLPWTKMLVEAEERGVLLDQATLDQKEQELLARKGEIRKQMDEQWKLAHEAYFWQQADDLKLKYADKVTTAILKLKNPTNEKLAAVKKRYDNLYAAALKKVPNGVNYDSPIQLRWLLKDYLGLNIVNFDGKESTEAAVLERLADEGREDVKLLVQYRKTEKLLEYIEQYRAFAVDGVVHPTYNPANTKTGRLSAEKPNLQQVNKFLKPVFRARPGYKFIVADLSAIEAKLIALYSEDPALHHIVTSGLSIHDYNVGVFFGYETPISEVKKVHPRERETAKSCGFALFYGAGANMIQETFHKKGFMFDLDTCRGLHENFKEAYSKAFEFHREVTRVFEAGEIIPNIMGRPLSVENRDDCYMQGFNKLIQSSGSDLNLNAAHKAQTRMRAEGMDATVVLLIHDCIGIEVQSARADEAYEILIQEMTSSNLANAIGPIKLEAEGYISDRWE